MHPLYGADVQQEMHDAESRQMGVIGRLSAFSEGSLYRLRKLNSIELAISRV